jgi:AcrR family transcriptional regulator
VTYYAQLVTDRRRNRRDEILRAALDVFAERGYRGASLAAVAERVGLTQQGLLHYFPSKEALLVEVLRLRDQLDLGRMGALSLDQLMTLVGYNATRPGIVQSFTVLSGESVTENHPARDYFVDRYDRLRRDLASSVQAEKLPPEILATLVIAVMDGLQLQWLLQPDQVDMPEAFEAFVRLLTD